MKANYLFLSAIAACALASCGSAKSDKIQIAATFAPIYDYAVRIAGDKAEIINVVGEYEPHDFSLNSSKAMSFIEKADLLLAYGHNIDQWASELNKDAYRLVTTGVEFMMKGEVEDPHAWLSIKRAKTMLQNVADALISVDEANKDYYEANLEKALEDYDKLDASYTETLVGKMSSPYLVTSHEAFGYLASDYGLTQIGINDIADHEPSASRIAEVVDFIEEHEVKCIFLEELDSAGNVETIKSELAERGYTVSYDVLSAYECSSESGYAEGGDFLSVMNANLETIAEWVA